MGVLWNPRLRLRSGLDIRRKGVKGFVLLLWRVKIPVGWGLQSRVLHNSCYALILLFRFIKGHVTMNSCSDLDLNFVSGSSTVTYHINARIRGLSKVTAQDGEGLKCLVYLYVLQGCSADSWQVFGLMVVLMQLFVTKLWWMCGLVMWYLKLCFFPLHTLQWRTVCWRFCEGVSHHLHVHGLRQPWICHRGMWATVSQSVF